MKNQSFAAVRHTYLAVGVLVMLFSGVLYAWSILKLPFVTEYQWSDAALAANFSLTMCFFCIGAFLGGLLGKKLSTRILLVLSALLVGVGFAVIRMLKEDQLPLLYVFYAMMAGSGIGLSYNVIVSTVCAWFPDRKGFCSGCLMMGFGLSTLLLGNLANVLFELPSFGWQKTYLGLGLVLAAVLLAAAFILRRPGADVVFPAAKAGKKKISESFLPRDFTTKEMFRSFAFWKAAVTITFIAAVGNSVISFARDLMLSVGAAPLLATTLVGVLSVFNGFGRILTGIVFDTLGRRFTMIAANIVTIAAAGITLIAVTVSSLPLCIVGLCLSGLSYGSCPTVSSAFTASFYGQKHFQMNYGVINCTLIGTSAIVTLCNRVLIATGSYTAPFILLLAAAAAALVLNFGIRKP